MKRTTLKVIDEIAQGVREWTEENALKADYNAKDLCGWCAIASAELFRQLTKAGIEGAVIHVSNWSHCFIVVEGYVVDVTATQFIEFQDTPVLLRRFSVLKHYEFYRSTQFFTDPLELRLRQEADRWPERQLAFKA